MHYVIPAVNLILVHEGHVLLGRRLHTGWQDGKLYLPGGHVERAESLAETACREAHEELGIIAESTDARLVHVLHRPSIDRVSMIFAFYTWGGEPRNAEPDKCSELVWAPLHDLPADTVEHVPHVIACFVDGVAYSTWGRV